MSGYSADHWIKVFGHCLQVGHRIYPRDHDMACEAASDTFDRFVRLHGADGVKDFRSYIGKSIRCYRKAEARREALLQRDEEDFNLDFVRVTPADQELVFDANRWRSKIETLPPRERAAFRILADGGTIRDVVIEMELGTRQALDLVASGRSRLHAPPNVAATISPIPPPA